MSASYSIRTGDCADLLSRMPDQSVRCCVTSPPYWGLRDYGMGGQLGLEASPGEYIAKLVRVFEEVRRVLAADGTLWLNLGDSYAGGGCGARDPVRWPKQSRNNHMPKHVKNTWLSGGAKTAKTAKTAKRARDVGRDPRLKPKDLIGIPWRVALALQDAGWWLRSDIIWSKPNPMPESVTDRPTRAHEYIFLLAKSERYFYDAAAIRERQVYGDHPRNGTPGFVVQAPGQPRQSGLTKVRSSGNKERKQRHAHGGTKDSTSNQAFGVPWVDHDGMRNKRSVWTVSPRPFPEAHFATFPEELILPCILAGSAQGDTILDPFAGSSTTGVVALKQGRSFVGLELNPEYVAMSRRRLAEANPLFSHEVAA